MKYVVSLLSRLDAAIQRRFNSVCFFLMLKFGARKSSLKYILFTIFSLGFGAIAVMRTNEASTLPLKIIGGSLGAIIFGILLLLQHLGYREDRHVEHALKFRSVSDEILAEFGWYKLVCLGGLLLHALWFPEPFTGRAGSLWCFREIWLFSPLPLLYIAKTPMNPPAEKAREHAGTPQTAPAQT